MRILIPAEVRFWAKVEKTDTCWNWIGGKNWGYGCFFLTNPRRSAKAHRHSWEMHNGPIPVGLVVCHRCDNRACVRPDHLFLGTCKDNMQDCVAKGRFNGGRRNAAKTHCPRGHDYAVEGRRRSDTGSRYCLQCLRDYKTEIRQRTISEVEAA